MMQKSSKYNYCIILTKTQSAHFLSSNNTKIEHIPPIKNNKPDQIRVNVCPFLDLFP